MRALWIALLCLALLAGSSNEAGEVDIDRPEEARVIAALFVDIAKDAPRLSIVLAPRSVTVDHSADDLKRALPDASDAVIDDLLAISSKPTPILPVKGLPHGAQVAIATAEQLDKIFNRLSPSFSSHRFGREFPGATNLLRLSRVGLDPKSGQAMIYVMTQCGMVCGSENVVLLQRSDAGWVRIGFAQLRIS